MELCFGLATSSRGLFGGFFLKEGGDGRLVWRKGSHGAEGDWVRVEKKMLLRSVSEIRRIRLQKKKKGCNNNCHVAIVPPSPQTSLLLFLAFVQTTTKGEQISSSSSSFPPFPVFFFSHLLTFSLSLWGSCLFKEK